LFFVIIVRLFPESVIRGQIRFIGQGAFCKRGASLIVIVNLDLARCRVGTRVDEEPGNTPDRCQIEDAILMGALDHLHEDLGGGTAGGIARTLADGTARTSDRLLPSFSSK
jgi:hypothetical protein